MPEEQTIPDAKMAGQSPEQIAEQKAAGENESLSKEQEQFPESASENSAERYQATLQQVKTSSSIGGDDAGVQMDAERVFHKADAESQIKHLVDIALEKGPIYAIKVAKHLEDNYVLDMLHDKLLTEELHKILIQKGLLEEN